jgi:phosphopentomutase
VCRCVHWGYFRDRENSFPPELLEALIARPTCPGVLGNCHASGTEIIARLGEEHVATGKPIVYTSADSVFQIAAHERPSAWSGSDAVRDRARAARCPTTSAGSSPVPSPVMPADFTRTANRRDYSVSPPHHPAERCIDAGGEVIAIGKIADIYAHSRHQRTVKADGNDALIDATLAGAGAGRRRSLVMTNFVDFDMLHGHRRDVAGYAAGPGALRSARLPELLGNCRDDDLLILTADHGCDPTFPGTDHTREHVPVLALGGGLCPGSLGARETFADIGQSLAISAMIGAGDHDIRQVWILGPRAIPCAPCGDCRQRLREFGDGGTFIYAVDDNGNILLERTLSQLLPDSFGPENLSD